MPETKEQWEKRQITWEKNGIIGTIVQLEVRLNHAYKNPRLGDIDALAMHTALNALADLRAAIRATFKKYQTTEYSQDDQT